MFNSSSDYVKTNENGEYEVAQGITANIFKHILVTIIIFTVVFTYVLKLSDNVCQNDQFIVKIFLTKVYSMCFYISVQASFLSRPVS